MKILLTAIFGLLFLSLCQAQRDALAFEGIIEYDITVKTKASGSIMFKDFFAKKMTLRIKENVIRCDYDSIGVDSVRLGYLLIKGDSNSVYRVMPHLKLIQQKKLSNLHEAEQVFEPEIYRPLHRKEQVSGIMCSMYLSEINMPMGGGKAKVILSCADGYHFPVKGNLLESSTLLMLGNGIRGIPLKKVIRFEDYDLEVIMKATRIHRETIADEWFSLPEQFRMEQFNRITMY